MKLSLKVLMDCGIDDACEDTVEENRRIHPNYNQATDDYVERLLASIVHCNTAIPIQSPRGQLFCRQEYSVNLQKSDWWQYRSMCTSSSRSWRKHRKGCVWVCVGRIAREREWEKTWCPFYSLKDSRRHLSFSFSRVESYMIGRYHWLREKTSPFPPSSGTQISSPRLLCLLWSFASFTHLEKFQVKYFCKEV